LVVAYPGSPGPKAVKWLCVCVCVCVCACVRARASASSSCGLPSICEFVCEIVHALKLPLVL